MSKLGTDSFKYRKLLFFVFVLTFLIGGSLQVVGLISNTVMTVGIAFLLFLVYIKEKLQSVKDALPTKFFLVLMALIAVSGYSNKTPVFLILLYMLLFAVIPALVSYIIINNLRGKLHLLTKFLFVVGSLQLPVIFIQQTFFSSILSVSARSVSETDIGFGTFFVANDHGLGFFLLCLIVYLLFYKTGLRNGTRLFLIFWFSLTILFANSYISLLLLAIVFLYFTVVNLNLRIVIVSFCSIGLFFMFLAFSGYQEVVEEKYMFIYKKIFEKDYESTAVDIVSQAKYAERGDILLYFLEQTFEVIGSGPYSYFDPINKEFTLFPNFSQLLWFYNDIGFIGVILVIIIFTRVYFKYNSLWSPAILYLGMILVFSFFSNTLSDLAFNIVFYLFVVNGSDVLLKDKKGKVEKKVCSTNN
ncbi:hypothetical protein RCC89_08935 [Cytophagaceae bacterium ABcell3]|nr:hypothetical protein RCC89_08935 [Cytophagaceae bacterium ABcell3]